MFTVMPLNTLKSMHVALVELKDQLIFMYFDTAIA